MVGFYRQKGVREGEVLAEEKKGLKKKKKELFQARRTLLGGRGVRQGSYPTRFHQEVSDWLFQR